MKTAILLATLVAICHVAMPTFINTGTFTYTDLNGRPLTITYVEDDNGMRITSHKFPPAEERRIIQKIKEHNVLMQQQLNQQLNQLNQQLNQQFGQLNQQLNQQFQQAFNPFPGFGGFNAGAATSYNPFGPGFPFNRKRRSTQ